MHYACTCEGATAFFTDPKGHPATVCIISPSSTEVLTWPTGKGHTHSSDPLRKNKPIGVSLVRWVWCVNDISVYNNSGRNLRLTNTYFYLYVGHSVATNTLKHPLSNPRSSKLFLFYVLLLNLRFCIPVKPQICQQQVNQAHLCLRVPLHNMSQSPFPYKETTLKAVSVT